MGQKKRWEGRGGGVQQVMHYTTPRSPATLLSSPVLLSLVVVLLLLLVFPIVNSPIFSPFSSLFFTVSSSVILSQFFFPFHVTLCHSFPLSLFLYHIIPFPIYSFFSSSSVISLPTPVFLLVYLFSHLPPSVHPIPSPSTFSPFNHTWVSPLPLPYWHGWRGGGRWAYMDGDDEMGSQGARLGRGWV